MFPVRFATPDGRKAPLAVLLAATLVGLACPLSASARSWTRVTPPTISGSPPTSVTAGKAYSFQPSASDPNGYALTFRIRNKPVWATFSSSTGQMSGVPSSSGTYSNVQISVTDGHASASLPSFTITVGQAQTAVTYSPPTLSGTPVVSAQVGQPYAFRPTASDPNNLTLTFSIQNPPAWATFDPATGTLYGTPAAAGTFAGIIISASDGKASASMAAFSITVAAAPTKSATVSWSPPTANTDGSPLTDLAGYQLYYGTASGQYSASLSLPSASMNSTVLQGLNSGTWYFSVRAVNSAGVQSNFSPEASAVL